MADRRTFVGAPPFALSASCFLNANRRYGSKRDTASFRVFLKDENGLIMRGARLAPFPVAWTARVGETVVKQGKLTGSWRARIPPMSDDERAKVELDLEVTTGTRRYKRTVSLKPSADLAQVGVLRVHGLPELAPNARVWSRWAHDLVRGFYDSTHVRPPEIAVYLWVESMPGLSGWGGWNDRRSYAYFSDGRLFGFVRAGARNDGTVSHELAHAFHQASHGASFQALQSRAVRRMKGLRRDVNRVPAGNAFRELLASPSRPAPPPGAKRPPPGASAGIDSQVGEDEAVAWYVRSVAGSDACNRWRRTWWAHRWYLSLKGFHDDVIHAAHATLHAGRDAAWLVRLRGGLVPPKRHALALALLQREPKLTTTGARRAVIKKWAEAPMPADWKAARTEMQAELGYRRQRVDTLVRWARLARPESVATCRELVLAALAEAWLDDNILFERTLEVGARLTATR